MSRYELKKNCLFVDAYDLDEAKKNPGNPPNRKKQEIKHAHVMDKGPEISSASTPNSPMCPYTELNDVAGFIGRFIVMGVETDSILPKIVASEYNIAEAKAKQEVDTVLALMKDYLNPRQTIRAHEPAKSPAKGKHTGYYDLDFRVNPMGIGVFKG